MPEKTHPSQPTPPWEPSSAVLTAQILTMILENGTTLATHQPRPHTLTALHLKRTALLRDAFFDERHERHELSARRHPPSPVLFMDIVVLMARLMRVLMRRDNERTEAEILERVDVRNECLDQPFFRRGRGDLTLPFGDHRGCEEDEEYWEGFSDGEYDYVQDDDDGGDGEKDFDEALDVEDADEDGEEGSQSTCSVD